MTRAVLTPRAVWWRARAPVGLSKLCQLLALSAWHGIAQERSAGSSIKQISAPCAWRESPEPSPGLVHCLVPCRLSGLQLLAGLQLALYPCMVHVACRAF